MGVTDTKENRSFSHKGFKGFFLVLLMSFFSFPFVSASSGIDFSTPLKWVTLLVLVGLMLFLLFFGALTRLPPFLILGFFILFVLGGYLQAGNILIPSGDTHFVYGNNFTDYHWDDYNDSSDAPSQADREAFLFHEVKEFELIQFELSHILGLFLMVISVFAIFFSLFIFIGSGGGSF